LGEIASQLPGDDRNATLYDVGIGASWEADLFCARRRAAQAAGADAQAAEAEHLATRIRPLLSSPATRKLTLEGNKGNTCAAMTVTPDESP
jgi:hypothetical protein